jgi:hypothetical protein
MTKNLKRIVTNASAGISAMVAAATPVAAQISDIETPKAFFEDIGLMINALLNFVVVIAALLVFVYLLWGGIEWITSGGDKGKTESARNKITAAIIGLIVLAAAYAILLIALNFLGYANLDEVFDLI